MYKSVEIPVRDRLLTSGALLFSEKSFDGVSVRKICKHAETSMNMIHHYFRNKEGLLNEIVQQFSSNVFALPIKLLDKPPQSKGDFLSRIELLFETTLEAFIEHRVIFLVVIREQENPEALVNYMKCFEDFLEQAKVNGYVRKELDSEMITGFLLDRIANQIQFAPWIKKNYGKDVLSDPEYLKKWCQSNLDLFINGVLKK